MLLYIARLRRSHACTPIGLLPVATMSARENDFSDRPGAANAG